MKTNNPHDMTPDELERFEEETVHERSDLDDRLPASEAEIAKENVREERPLDVPPIAPD
jgi:hypothetical protein